MARRLMLIDIRLRWGHRPWFHPMGKLFLPNLIMLGICLWNISLLRTTRSSRVNRLKNIVWVQRNMRSYGVPSRRRCIEITLSCIYLPGP